MGADTVAAEIAEHIPRRHAPAPTGFEPSVRYDPATGVPTEVTTGPLADDVQDKPGQWRELVQRLGLVLPDGYEAQLVEARFDPLAWSRDAAFVPHPGRDDVPTKAPALTRPAWRYRFKIVRTAAAALPDLAELHAIAKANRPPAGTRRSRKTVTGARVVVTSDAQIGKVASGGGTPELVARVGSMLAKLDEVMRDEPRAESVTVDPGDLCEGFENVAAQQHTNDLSHPDQLRVARAVLTDVVTTVAARHQTSRVLTVPSNHTQWRRGKELIGRPGDDYGLDVHRAVAEALARDRVFRDVAFVVPDPWRESLAVQVRAAVLGLVHGHQAKGPARVWEWWQGQIAGDGPAAAAHILITGHWHSFLVQPHGRLDGRPRWHMQADPLDGGSDWFANLTGEQSEPSLLTFTIDDDGRWRDLHRITA